MICDQCLVRIAQTTSRRVAYRTTRSFTSSTINQAALPAQTTTSVPRPNGTPAATSTSAAQPFSAGTAPKLATTSKIVRPPSSVAAGTPLRGINFMKNQQDPVAMEDHEYPDWLWGILDKKASDQDSLDGEGDLFSKSKKQRRVAAKALRKRQLLNPDSLVPKVPLYEQSIDLYAGDGTVDGANQAAAARRELTKAMRDHRRSKIKEANFLKAMG